MLSNPLLQNDQSFQTAVSLKVIVGLYKGVSTVELDNLAAETAAAMTTQHPDYAILAARIAVSNLHKKTEKVGTVHIEQIFSMGCVPREFYQ